MVATTYSCINVETVTRPTMMGRNEVETHVGIITLNRPEVLNALNLQLVRETDRALSDFEADDSVGAVIITGAGERAFSAGADIHENRELSPEQREQARRNAPNTPGTCTPAASPSSEPSTVCATVAARYWPPAWTSW